MGFTELKAPFEGKYQAIEAGFDLLYFLRVRCHGLLPWSSIASFL
jgi:hypothetical protein